jgi:hypothetical protein
VFALNWLSMKASRSSLFTRQGPPFNRREKDGKTPNRVLEESAFWMVLRMIHAQTVRDDQLDEMKELGIIPSFFSMHAYYWGNTKTAIEFNQTSGREEKHATRG